MAREIETLRDLYVEELQDLYNAEIQLAKTMPDMAKRTQSDDLCQVLNDEGADARQHAERLLKILSSLQREPNGQRCHGMEGLLQQGEEMIQDCGPTALDAGLIIIAQKAQHYEIAGYGCAANFAMILGRSEDAALLHQTLDEERRTDEKLTRMANHAVNFAAVAV